MKKLFLMIALAVTCSITVIYTNTGCTTNQQQIAVQSLDTLEDGVTTAYTGYMDLVIQKKIATNSVPLVSKRYNQFQLHWLLALDAVQYNTNALASPALSREGADVINVINSYKK